MAVELRPLTAVVFLIAVLAVGSFGSIVVTDAVESHREPTPQYLELSTTDRAVWSYTSASRTFDRPTLAINAVVYGDADAVKQLLLTGERGGWNVTGESEEDAAIDESAAEPSRTAIGWALADGSQRYVYLTGEHQGRWLDERYQIHDGDYLGSRHHVRAYTIQGADWTAMQAHHEYWDWFKAGHVVTSVDTAQAKLERDLLARSSAFDVSRVPVGGADRTVFDRWLTVVEIRGPEVAALSVLPVVLLGAIGRRFAMGWSPQTRRAVGRIVQTGTLVVGIVALLLSVRLFGIWLEGVVSIPPKQIAFLLYPALFAGLPAVTYFLARPLDPARAFGAAAMAFLAGTLLDYTYLGVTHVALDVLVYRGGLALALGLIASGAIRAGTGEDGQYRRLRFGLLLWLVAVTFPLVKYTPLAV